MPRGLRYGIAFILGVACTLAVLLLRGRPTTYQECLLANSRDVQSQDRLMVVAQVCAVRFPQKKEQENPLLARTDDPLLWMVLTGRAGIQYGKRFGGTLYNGSPTDTITSADIEVSAISGRDTTKRVYRVSVFIPPLTTSDFQFDIVLGGEGARYEWVVAGATGYSHLPATSSVDTLGRGSPAAKTR